jgi:hypothetical protein
MLFLIIHKSHSFLEEELSVVTNIVDFVRSVMF